MSWQETLKALKMENIKAKTPAAFEASGAYTMKIKPYNDRTTNGLTKCIVDWINFNGGHAIRINTQGQARKEKVQLAFGNVLEKVRFTKSTTALGTADIKATVQGPSVNIEIKTGRDTIKPAQLLQRGKEEAAGGLYFVARDMQSFVEWFEYAFHNKLKKSE